MNPNQPNAQTPEKKEPPFWDKWPEWECQIKPESEPVNVGTKMSLNCSGEFVELPLQEGAKIQFASDADKYTMNILKVRQWTNENVQMTVTSYKPGDHKAHVFAVGDNNSGFKVKPINYTVQSVIEPGKQVEPFPSYGPFDLSMPMWYWISIGLAAFIVIGFLTYKIRKFLARKRLIEELTTHGTALPPFHQFNKDLRSIVRTWQRSKSISSYEQSTPKQVVEKVDKVLRQYIMRELLIPTFDWTDGEVFSEIKKRHRKVYRDSSDDLRRVFRELKEATQSKSKVSDVDCEQLVFMSRNLAEKINLSKKRKAK